jgi:AcrR family transcriptional regulator
VYEQASSTLYDVSTGHRSPRSNPRGSKAKRSKPTPEEKAAAKVEKAVAQVDKAAAKADAVAGAAEKVAAQVARKRDQLEELSRRLGGFDMWTRTEPGSRRPRFSRDAIATAAVRIADDEGLDALSMRRLAAELGSGTMTLYHYVHTKDELLALAVDAAMAEVAIPDGTPMPRDWRAAITDVARRSRATVERHPWMLEISFEPPFGPNAVRHFDQTLAALSSLPVPLDDKLDIARLVDEYVFGYCLQRRAFSFDGNGPQVGRVVSYVESLLATDRYPQLSALAETFGLREAWERIQDQAADEGRFERNLARLLDGVEQSLPPR